MLDKGEGRKKEEDAVFPVSSFIPMYEHVARLAQYWNARNNIGLVVGATHPEVMAEIRAAVPGLWFLSPGVGAQGGELEAALKAGLRKDGKGMLIPVSRAISRRLQRSSESSSARLARRAVQLLEAGEVRVDRVAERLGITARHLRRTFTEHVGVGPKEYARSVRLLRALRLAAGSSDWRRVALDAGYYDQAHLIADFRHLVGTTPGAFVTRPRAANLRCT